MGFYPRISLGWSCMACTHPSTQSVSFAMALIGFAISTPISSAHEVATYSYDQQGRVVQVQHGGTGENTDLKIVYQYDKTGNRVSYQVDGSRNKGQHVVVVPLGAGYSIIPINP